MSQANPQPTYDIKASVHVKAAPDVVYKIATDVTRMGEWSPENIGAEWVQGQPGSLGARFHGHNRVGERTWTTECEIVAADPDRRFAWAVLTAAQDADTAVWSFEIEPDPDGALLTQRFVMRRPTDGLVRVKDALPPEQAVKFLEDRKAALQSALRLTINGIKEAAEK
jgi:hypothetical protein